MTERTILHCDLNNFYASVECIFQPEYRNVPMAVGGDQQARRGVVLAKNELAKSFGVTTGEPIVQAKRKCPSLVVAQAHHERYEEYSQKAHDIYARYTDKIEPFGIDECWLDVTESLNLFGDGKQIADRLRSEIRGELGLTISVGVSFNKVFAKLGSDLKKPDATSLITSGNFKEIVWTLPANDLLYVGKKTAKRLESVGIFTIGDIARTSSEYLTRMLGKMGSVLYNYANGLDDSPVDETSYMAANKSVGSHVTTAKDLKSNEEVRELLLEIAGGVAVRLRRHGEKCRTVHVIMKNTELSVITRQGQLSNPSNIASVIAQKAYEIFLKNWEWTKNIRMLGISVSDLQEGEVAAQLSLFDDSGKSEKQEQIEDSIDKIRGKYGKDIIKRGL